MLFNEKLYKLRKENGLSQEALAEKLNTTRQAVSKWENNQGFPETEKLLLISNLFNVSVDYLLKDTSEDSSVDDKGYYASKEMVEGYFFNRKSAFATISIGFFIFILGIGAYFKFDNENMTPTIMIVLLILGGIIIVKGIFKSNDKFDVLEKEYLIFDRNYHSELQKNYKHKSSKLSAVFGVSFVVFMVSAVIMTIDIAPFSKDFRNGIPLALELLFIVFAIAVPTMFYSGTISEMYSLIIDNEKHTNSFSFRLSKKLKTKLNLWLK